MSATPLSYPARGQTSSPNLVDEDLKHDEEVVENVTAEDLGPSYTPAEERKVRWRMDLILLPVLCFLNLCSFLDKTNIGNANVAGMSKDLGFSQKQFNFLLTIFYVVYTCSQWEFLLLK